jgi:hypothetical protein
MIYVILVGAAVYGLLFGSFTAMVASSKGRDGASWFVLGLLFGLLALLAVGFMESEKRTGRPGAVPPASQFVWPGIRPSGGPKDTHAIVAESHRPSGSVLVAKTGFPQVTTSGGNVGGNPGDRLQPSASELQPPPASPAEPDADRHDRQRPDDVFLQIEKLAELHKSGILTNEEFESKKSELLSRI